MIRLAAAAAALLAAGTQDSSPPAEADFAQVFGQVRVRQQIIIRVPRAQNRVEANAAPARWRETSGPRCISARQVAAAMPGADRVDLLMRDNSRIRARLGGRCAALDYYRGLYVDANADGRICAERDVVRSRMGGHCEITEFRLLQPGR
jgi:hypothetical protein